jgi:hypothetical protein
MRVIALGGYPATNMEHPKQLIKTEEIISELIFREQDGIKLYREVLAQCGENEGTRQVLEGIIAVEQDHVDELWRWYKNPESMRKAGADQESAGQATISEGQRKREHAHSFERDVPGGISGGAGPDLPERGRDWHGTVPGVPDEPQDGESSDLDKPPENLVKPITPDFNDPAMKALAGAPRFSPGPFIPPPYKSWLMEQGYTSEEIDSGQFEFPSRRRAEFNKYLTSTVQKSITSLSRFCSE